MHQPERFWENVKQEERGLLATSAGGHVTMRTISPVYYDNAVLMFIGPGSTTLRQLRENPNCCLAAGGCFLEAKAEFLGAAMLEENAPLREAYVKKFPDAFDENAVFGGRSAEFVLLRPVLLKGWNFENGIPTGPFQHKF